RPAALHGDVPELAVAETACRDADRLLREDAEAGRRHRCAIHAARVRPGFAYLERARPEEEVDRTRRGCLRVEVEVQGHGRGAVPIAGPGDHQCGSTTEGCLPQ